MFDGVAEVWCDSLAAAQLMFEEPKFAEVVTPDERQFLDMNGTVILLMSQHLIYQRRAAPIHGGVKLFELPSRRREMTRSECHRHWRDIHAPLVLGSAEMIKPLRRYVQSHSLEDGAGGLPPMRYDGMAELWFDNVDDLKACFGRQYMEAVHPDEPRFVDPSAQQRFGRQRVRYLRTPVNASASVRAHTWKSRIIAYVSSPPST